MAPARYERLREQAADDQDDCRSETTVESVGSERILNDPPDRHDIWNQPWWLFLLMVLLFLGLVAASIGVHAAVCSSKPIVTDPITDAAFTKLLIREQLSTMYIGRGANTTMCSIPRLSVDGIGPSWSLTSETVSMSNLNFVLGDRILLSVSNALQALVDFGVQSTLGIEQSVAPGRIRLIDVPQADIFLAQLSAGTTTVESQRGFQRGRGLSIPMIVGGNLPDITSDYNTDLIGAIDTAKNVVFMLQDACLRARHGNETRNSCGDCLENNNLSVLSEMTEVEYGVIASNNHFEHHMHSLLVEPGIPVRLRVYNSASGTNFFLNITSDDVFVESKLIAIDGHWIAPIDVNTLTERLWVGVGQRMDILVFVPNRRWTRILILAVEEGREFGRQTGMSLQTDMSMSSSRTVKDPPRLGESALYKSWGTELVARKPIFGNGLEEYEVELTNPAELTNSAAHSVLTADVNAVLYLDNQNTVNGRRGTNTSNATYVHVTLGNQVSITFVSNATEALPMRVYGHSFTISRLNGKVVESGIERDTVLIPPKNNVTISFTALNPGSFPIACMNEFRRAKGMVAYIILTD